MYTRLTRFAVPQGCLHYGIKCEGSGDGGEGSGGGRQAAWELGFDVDELEVRAAGATSAKLAAQAGEQGRVRKRKKAEAKGWQRRQREEGLG